MLEEHVLVSFLQKFDQYPFCMKINGKEYRTGEEEPELTTNVKKSIPLTSLMVSTSLMLSKAYTSGNLEIEGNLCYALDHFLGRVDKFSTDESTLKKLMHPPTTKHNQQKKAQSHYDIGNDFYKLQLNETMSYSYGYFLHPDDTLLQTQVSKVDYILQKLYLKKGISLLDISCGWGSLLIEAAKKYDVREMGTTLSEGQYWEVKRRIVAERLEKLITVELVDYRDLPKCGRRFDRIASVGVMRHVGRDHYQLFMDCGKRVLKPSKLFSLRFIDGLKEHARDPRIRKYILQRGMAPSPREVLAYTAEDGFHTSGVGDLRPHYNRTLLCRERSYRGHLNEVRSMSGERFARMWDLYLSARAATFYNGIIDLRRILFSEGINNQLPLVRWY